MMRRLLGVLSLLAALLAGAEERVIDFGGSAVVRFQLAQSDAERWPEAVSLTLRDAKSGAVRNASISSRMTSRVHVLRVAPGVYELTLEAAHHRAVQRSLTAPSDLGVVRLERYPALTGRVRTSTGSPVAGAFVTDRAALSAKTDALGAFTIEVTGEWPRSIEISYPGLTTKEIPVPRAQASAKLPDVTLVKGSRLQIDLDNLPHDVDVDLVREGEFPQVNVLKTLKTMRVSKGSPRAEFEDLDRGEYIVVVRGSGPLQQLARRIKVSESEVAQAIAIDPIEVVFEVRRGESPVAGAKVIAQSDGNAWSRELVADAQGEAATEVWQRGEYAFAVHAPKAETPVLLIASVEESRVRLELPDRTITGRVTDADGAPIAGATVSVQINSDDGNEGGLTVVSATDGMFTVDGLRDGSHTLRAEASGFVRSDAVTVRVDQTLPRRDVAIELSRGSAREVRITTRAGYPIANAMVIVVSGSGWPEMLNTNHAGRATFRTPSGASSVVYVFPVEGSFAIARLGANATNPHSIVVPEGVATLEVHAKDTSGKAIPNVGFVMRYDGELIPPDVADILMTKRGFIPITGADGIGRLHRLPPGLLELWPARGAQELEDIVAGGARTAPVQVALKEGLNVATMTFEHKR